MSWLEAHLCYLKVVDYSSYLCQSMPIRPDILNEVSLRKPHGHMATPLWSFRELILRTSCWTCECSMPQSLFSIKASLYLNRSEYRNKRELWFVGSMSIGLLPQTLQPRLARQQESSLTVAFFNTNRFHKVYSGHDLGSRHYILM